MKNKVMAITLSIILATSILIIPVSASSIPMVSNPDNFGYFGEERVAYYENFSISMNIVNASGQYVREWYNFQNVYAFRTEDPNYVTVKLLSLESFNGTLQTYNNGVVTNTSSVSSQYMAVYHYYYFFISEFNKGYNPNFDWHDMPINPNGNNAPQYVVDSNDVTLDTPPNSLQYSLPAGNVAVIQLGSGSNPYELTTVASEPGPFDGTGLNGTQILFTNSIPSTLGYPLSGASSIQWSGYDSTTVLGQYYLYRTSGDLIFDAGGNQYMIIVNPTYGYDSSGTRANPRIEIYVDKCTGFKIYPLGTQLTQGGWTSNNDGTEYTSVYDDDTGTWYTVDSQGNVVEPSVGGSNIITTTATTIFDFLENIANEISGFFTGAIGAVTTVANAISNFAGTLRALYVWLPSPVLSLLQSAIMLAIVIGVVKVFV